MCSFLFFLATMWFLNYSWYPIRMLLGPLSKVKESRWDSGHFTQSKQFHYICLNTDLNSIFNTIKIFTVIIYNLFMLKSKRVCKSQYLVYNLHKVKIYDQKYLTLNKNDLINWNYMTVLYSSEKSNAHKYYHIRENIKHQYN